MSLLPHSLPLDGAKRDHSIRLPTLKGTTNSETLGGEDPREFRSSFGNQAQTPDIQMTDVQQAASVLGTSPLSYESNMSGSGPSSQYSERLPIVDPNWKARIETSLGREKRSPYAILWEPGHDQFITTLRARYDINDEEALPNVESHAYATTLRRSRPVECLTETDLKARAIRRGRHRAMLQTALRTLATNKEQDYRGGWWPPVVDPAPQPPSNQQRTAPLPSNDLESSSQDPFFYTKRYLEFRNQQRLLERLVIANGLSDDISEEWAHAGQHVFAKPFTSVSIIKARMAKTAKFLSSVLLRFTGGESITRLTASPPDLPPEQVQHWKQRALLIRSIQAGARTYTGPKYPGTTLLDPHELRTLQMMSQVYLSEVSRENIRQFGRKFGQLYQKLMQQFHSIGQSLEVRSALVQRARRAIKTRRRAMVTSFPDRTEQSLSVVELATPLHTGRGRLTHKTAARLVQSRIAEECHQSTRRATTDHRQLWSFSASIPAEIRRRQWFSLEKWPPQSSANSGNRQNQLSDPMSVDPPVVEMPDPMSLNLPERSFRETISINSVPAAGSGALMPSEILNWHDPE